MATPTVDTVGQCGLCLFGVVCVYSRRLGSGGLGVKLVARRLLIIPPAVSDLLLGVISSESAEKMVGDIP